MPILIPAELESPLQQGDLLHGCPLTFTGADGRPAQLATTPPYLLVISRDCRALRDQYVVVFQVTSYTFDYSETSFEGLLRIFQVDRDGGRQPDVFYLGPIEKGKRFAARMSLPFVIEVPTEPERATWVQRTRVARLHPDFIGHLHSRIFGSFARKGFDDHAWLQDEDLEVLVRRGEADIRALEAVEVGARANQDDAQLRNLKPKVIKNLKQDEESAAQKLNKLRELVDPFKREQERRRSSRPSASDPSEE